MARNAHTSDDFDSMAAELSGAVDALKEIATLMRESELPFSLIHGTTASNVYVPALLDWIGKAKVDTQSQVRAHLAGKQSKAEFHKQQNQSRKAAAAKKPWKKATKKAGK
jgi:hypothetical protein